MVHSGLPIQDVPPYELEPRGCTALLDAVGRAINETGARLSGMAEAGGMGIHASGAANFSMDKVAASYDAASSKVARMRSQRRASQPVSNEFTEEEGRRMK